MTTDKKESRGMSREELAAIRQAADMMSDHAPGFASWWAVAVDLLAHIDAQAAQIEALREKLVNERATHIDAMCKYDDMGGRCTMGVAGWCVDCNQKDRIMGLAHKQLAEDEKLKGAGVTWDE